MLDNLNKLHRAHRINIEIFENERKRCLFTDIQHTHSTRTPAAEHTHTPKEVAAARSSILSKTITNLTTKMELKTSVAS